ncbi:MAG: hypothetical protein K9G48_03420 [Reyranella sp.]|nr:hypothetical protein [Reyranella sp.]
MRGRLDGGDSHSLDSDDLKPAAAAERAVGILQDLTSRGSTFLLKFWCASNTRARLEASTSVATTMRAWPGSRGGASARRKIVALGKSMRVTLVSSIGPRANPWPATNFATCWSLAKMSSAT